MHPHVSATKPRKQSAWWNLRACAYPNLQKQKSEIISQQPDRIPYQHPAGQLALLWSAPLHSDVGASECIHQETVRRQWHLRGLMHSSAFCYCSRQEIRSQAFATSSLQPRIRWLRVRQLESSLVGTQRTERDQQQCSDFGFNPAP